MEMFSVFRYAIAEGDLKMLQHLGWLRTNGMATDLYL